VPCLFEHILRSLSWHMIKIDFFLLKIINTIFDIAHILANEFRVKHRVVAVVEYMFNSAIRCTSSQESM